jgi:hypothetical protein
VVLGGCEVGGAGYLVDQCTCTSRAEILGNNSSEPEAKILPPLSCGPISSLAAIVINKSQSDQGQVLILSLVAWARVKWTGVHNGPQCAR